MISTLLSVNIFTGRPFYMGARGARKWYHGCYYSYNRVLNSIILIRHLCWSSIIFICHPFPALAHIIAKGTLKRHRKCHYSSQRPEKL